MSVEKIAGDVSTEVALAKIWSDLFLCSAPLTSTDNFFALGGDSIMMMMMIIEVSRSFGVELSPEQLFERATLGEVAATIDELRTELRTDSSSLERGYL